MHIVHATKRISQMLCTMTLDIFRIYQIPASILQKINKSVIRKGIDRQVVLKSQNCIASLSINNLDFELQTFDMTKSQSNFFPIYF